LGVTDFPNGISASAGFISESGVYTKRGTAAIVSGAGTVSTGLTSTTGFVATINAALGGTANDTANSVGGSVLGGTALVLGIRDHAGAAAAGTVTVGWIAWGT